MPAPATPPTAPNVRPADRTALVVKQVVVTAPTQATPVRGFLARNRTVLLFALFLFLADFGIGALAPLWYRYSPDDYTARINGCAERPRDLVFVGGSPVTEGIDPAQLTGAAWRGHTLSDPYAIGLHGGTATDFYYATTRACPTAPRVIVYGATASDLNDSRNEPHGTRTLLAPRDVAELAQTRPDAANWTIRQYLTSKAGQASNVYRYRYGIRMWAAIQADAVFPGSCPEAAAQATEQRDHSDDLARGGTGYAPLRGYTLIRYDRLKAAGQPSPPFAFLNQYRTGSHLKYVHKLTDWCRDHGTELVLLDMPVTADLEAKYAAEFAEYRARLAEIAHERGLALIRGADAGLTNDDFADQIHMTQDGCRKFSLWLRATLEEAGRAP